VLEDFFRNFCPIFFAKFSYLPYLIQYRAYQTRIRFGVQSLFNAVNFCPNNPCD